jgi:hypothetical protein
MLSPLAEVSVLRIFYSWNLDRGQRLVIYRALAQALHQAAYRVGASPQQAEVVQCEGVEKPTDIARFIRETIPTCHAFVGDISFINAADENRTRRTPNPNVMFEIGLATQCLGEAKVILVFSTDSGDDAKDLPFDVRNHSIIMWSSKGPAKRENRLERPDG